MLIRLYSIRAYSILTQLCMLSSFSVCGCTHLLCDVDRLSIKQVVHGQFRLLHQYDIPTNMHESVDKEEEEEEEEEDEDR